MPRIFGSNTKDKIAESKLKFSFLTKCHRLSLKAADSTEYAEIVRIESEKENAKQAAAAWRSWARLTSRIFVVVQGLLVVLNLISLGIFIQGDQERWISEKHIEFTWTMQKLILWIHRISLLICLILQVWLSLPEVILMVIAIGFADVAILQKLTSQGKDDKKMRMAFELILVVFMFLIWIYILNVNFDKSVVESQEKLRVALGDFGQEFKIKLD